MKQLISFFLRVGQVKRLKQRGLVLRGIEDPARIGGHSFREAIMGWVLAHTDETLDSSRLIKTTLVRDLCMGYAGDLTPYEPVLWKTDQTETKEMYEKWVRLSKQEKEEFQQKQRKHVEKICGELTNVLPESFRNEAHDLLTDYHEGRTREGRFVQQLHMMENFVQSLEYWEKHKSFPIESWWQQMKELVTEPALIDLLQDLDQEFSDSKHLISNGSQKREEAHL